MKNKVAATLILVLSFMLMIAGCGSGNQNQKQGQDNAKKDEAKEMETVSGASQAGYTPIDQLKDKYDHCRCRRCQYVCAFSATAN